MNSIGSIDAIDARDSKGIDVCIIFTTINNAGRVPRIVIVNRSHKIQALA